MKKNITNPEELSPWYVNQTLAVGENEGYEAWLEGHPEAKDDLRFWQDIKKSVAVQPRLLPPPGLYKQTINRIEQQSTSRSAARGIIPAIASGIAVTLIVFVLLWVVVKPGTTLRWSVNRAVPAHFRIYRALVNSQDYTLVGELFAQDNQLVYQYNDLLSLPGRSYRYRVEGVNNSGGITFSKAVTSDPRSILPGQLGILLTSFIMGYVCLAFLRVLPRLFVRRAVGVIG